MTNNQETNIKQQIKGRPMLYWAGKKPLGVIKNYPAQLVEKIGNIKNQEEITKPNYENLKVENGELHHYSFYLGRCFSSLEEAKHDFDFRQ